MGLHRNLIRTDLEESYVTCSTKKALWAESNFSRKTSLKKTLSLATFCTYILNFSLIVSFLVMYQFGSLYSIAIMKNIFRNWKVILYTVHNGRKPHIYILCMSFHHYIFKLFFFLFSFTFASRFLRQVIKITWG